MIKSLPYWLITYYTALVSCVVTEVLEKIAATLVFFENEFLHFLLGSEVLKTTALAGRQALNGCKMD